MLHNNLVIITIVKNEKSDTSCISLDSITN